MKYIALLRGINVGGNNIIKMVALKACFEKLGLKDVSTLIQSGNVIFSAPASNIETLCKKIEDALFKTFKYAALVVLIRERDLLKVVRSAPKGFGTDLKTYRCDVIFLKSPLKAKDAIKEMPLKEGVDEVRAGTGVLYFSRLDSKATQSRLSRVVSMPIYQKMTIRNWNTTQKLFALMEKGS
jgi:uncharacterized protein (DUF1697 family)